MSADPEPIEAELVDEPRPRRSARPRPAAAAPPREPAAPLHIEIHAWPKLFRARAVITESGRRRREISLDGSLAVTLLTWLSSLR